MQVGDWVVNKEGTICGQIIRTGQTLTHPTIWVKRKLITVMDGKKIRTKSMTLPFLAETFTVIPEPVAKIIISNYEVPLSSNS